MSASKEHAISLKTYYAVFIALLVLTAVTTAVAYIPVSNMGRIPAGAIHLILALIIAGAKATLVVLYFMHVRHASGLTRLFIAASLGFLLLLMGFTFADVLRR